MADSLDGTVKVPGAGRVPKKAAAAGLLVVGVLIVVYYYRKKNSASSATAASQAASSTDQYPPDGTTGNPQDPYSTDPATGQTYGNESTGSGGTYGAYGYSSAMSSTYPWDGTTGNQADPFSLDPATGVTFGAEGLATGGANANPNGGPPFANNSDWEVWVVNQLEETDPNLSAGDLTTALGLYLNGQPVSPAQKTLVFDATGAGGDPPVAGPQGYPPAVRTNGSTGGAEGTVPVPQCAGQTAGEAHNLIVAAGLKPADPNAGNPGEASWKCTGTKPAAGAKVQPGSSVEILSARPAATTTVPVLHRGENAGSIHNAIAAAGLVPVAGNRQQASWIVKSISPPSGTRVAKGSRVVINATGK